MKTCQTCKHWGGNRNIKEDQGHRLKSCDAPLIRYGYHHEEEEVADNGALVEYAEAWGMLTGPNFGCVLHEDEDFQEFKIPVNDASKIARIRALLKKIGIDWEKSHRHSALSTPPKGSLMQKSEEITKNYIRRRYWFGWWWASICSNHRPYNHLCGLCRQGYWTRESRRHRWFGLF